MVSLLGNVLVHKAHRRNLTFGIALYGLQLTAVHKIST